MQFRHFVALISFGLLGACSESVTVPQIVDPNIRIDSIAANTEWAVAVNYGATTDNFATGVSRMSNLVSPDGKFPQMAFSGYGQPVFIQLHGTESAMVATVTNNYQIISFKNIGLAPVVLQPDDSDALRVDGTVQFLYESVGDQLPIPNSDFYGWNSIFDSTRVVRSEKSLVQNFASYAPDPHSSQVFFGSGSAVHCRESKQVVVKIPTLPFSVSYRGGPSVDYVANDKLVTVTCYRLDEAPFFVRAGLAAQKFQTIRAPAIGAVQVH